MIIPHFLGIKTQLLEINKILTQKFVQKVSHNIHNFQQINNNPNSLSVAQNDCRVFKEKFKHSQK